jgi:hypothetical protein
MNSALPSIMVQWDELGCGNLMVWELVEEKIRLPLTHNSKSFNTSITDGSS